MRGLELTLTRSVVQVLLVEGIRPEGAVEAFNRPTGNGDAPENSYGPYSTASLLGT